MNLPADVKHVSGYLFRNISRHPAFLNHVMKHHTRTSIGNLVSFSRWGDRTPYCPATLPNPETIPDFWPETNPDQNSGAYPGFLAGGALSGAKQQVVRLASRVRRRKVPPIELRLWSGARQLGGLGAKPPLLILDPESTCKWHCNKKSNSHSGCKNELQVDFKVQLENKITITCH